MSNGSGFAKITVLCVFTIYLQLFKISIAQRFLVVWDISDYQYVIIDTGNIYNLQHLCHEIGQELFGDAPSCAI